MTEIWQRGSELFLTNGTLDEGVQEVFRTMCPPGSQVTGVLVYNASNFEVHFRKAGRSFAASFSVTDVRELPGPTEQ